MNLVEATIEGDTISFAGFRLPIGDRPGWPIDGGSVSWGSAPRTWRTRTCGAAAAP